MPRLLLRTLGGLEIQVDGNRIDDLGSRKTRALLVYLAIESGPEHQRAHLAGLLWPERPESTARTYLRQSIATLRDIFSDRSASEPFLVATRQTVRFNPRSDFWVDVVSIVSGLAGACGPDPCAMTPHDAHRFGEAVKLYRGAFLEGFYLDGCSEFGEWQLLTREHSQRMVIETLERLTRWHRQAGTMPAALSYARRRVELDPLSEHGQRQYMHLLAEVGEGNAALALYDQYRDVLLESLNTEPAPATTKLAASIRNSEIGVVSMGNLDIAANEAPVFLRQSIRRPRHPFVGRERELDELAHHLSDAAGDTQQGRIVFVTGAAGQGKTELMLEFARRASAERDNLFVAVGQCTSRGGAGDPLSPFRQILAQLTGDLRPPWSAGLLDDTQVRRLWTASPGTIKLLLDYAPDLVESLALEPSLRMRIRSFPRAVAESLLVSLPDGETGTHEDSRRFALYEQFTRLLTAISEKQPLLLLLDDLHWADSDSLSLLLHLGHALTGNRIFVLGAFRAEEVMQPVHEEAHPLQMVYQELQRQGYAPLDLDRVNGRSFVDALLDREANAFDENFRSTLYGLTAGSPLFTSELVYSMQENGDIVRTPSGGWEESPSLSWDVMPSRMEAVLGRRMAQLTPSQRMLLMAASVEGEQFTAEVTAAVLDRNASEVAQELSAALERRHRLVFAEGLERVGDSRLARYRFRHALFQQYLSAQLDPVEMGRLHESTARALESIYGPHPDGLAPIAGRLAWHWQEAEFPERAIAYHMQAGDWALRLSAYAQALDHYERGLDLVGRVSGRLERSRLEFELTIRLVDVQAMVYGGASNQVEQTLVRAREISHGGYNNDTLQSRLMDRTWTFYHQRGQNRGALQFAQSYLAFAAQTQRHDFIAQAHSNLGTTLTRLGQFGPALEHFERARASMVVFDPATDHQEASDEAVIVGVSEANVLWYLGYPDRAHRRSDATVSMAEEHASAYRLVFALIFTCGLHGRCREWRRLMECAERAHRLSTEHNFTMWKAVSSLYRAWALVSVGDCQTGMALASSALGAIGQTELLHLRYPSIMASVYASCGCVREALAMINEASALMKNTDEREWEPEIHRLHGELLLGQDGTNVDEAEKYYRKAVDVAREQESRMLELRAATSLCALWHAQGKDRAAHKLLLECYGWFTEGFDSPDLVAARRQLAQLRNGGSTSIP